MLYDAIYTEYNGIIWEIIYLSMIAAQKSGRRHIQEISSIIPLPARIKISISGEAIILC